MSQPLSPVLWYSQWGWGQFRISTFFSPKDFPTSDVFISWRRAALRYLSERPPAVERFGRSNRDRASGLWTVWHLIACFAVTAHIWIDSGLLCGTCNQRRRTRSRRFREDLRSWRRSRSKLGSLWSRSPNYGVLSCSFAAVTVDSNNSRPSSWNRDVTLQKRKSSNPVCSSIQKQEFRCFGRSSSQQSGRSRQLPSLNESYSGRRLCLNSSDYGLQWQNSLKVDSSKVCLE